MTYEPKKKPDWLKVKAAYQKGEGSCREIAEKWGINHHTVEARCKREGWNKAKSEIAQKVTDKVVDLVAQDAAAFLTDTIKRGMKFRDEIDESKQQMYPAIDPVGLDALSRVEVRITDMIRKAFGIPDVPQKHEVQGNVTFKLIDPYSEQDKGIE